jgi:hypothetical protein
MKMSIESHRWRLLLGPRPRMGSLSDWGLTLFSLRVASVSRRLYWSIGSGRRVPTMGASSTRVWIAMWVLFLSLFIVCNHFLWWFWLNFLIWYYNFSGMALDHVIVSTGRKSMLSTSKNLLQRRLMRVHLCMMRQWTSRRSQSMRNWQMFYLF